MKNFWEQFDRPILAVAPMAGITDSAFRQVCISFGANLVYSEMASVDALFYSPQKTIEMLYFQKNEKPYVVQLFGTKPEYFEKAVALLDKKLKPDGYDINFGCPVKKVIKQGAGAALMSNLFKSREVIKAVLGSTDKPLSVKTRTESGDVNILSFLENIKDLKVSALMIHGRTFKQGFSGEIDYLAIKNSRRFFSGKLIANGGINSQEDAIKMLEETGSDGLGIARGMLGRPWIFEEIIKEKDIQKSKEEIFKIALIHALKAIELRGESVIPELRKHLSWYMSGLEGASELRKMAISVKNPDDIKNLLKS